MTKYADGSYRISNSEIKTFKNCTRHWLLGYHFGYRKKRNPDDATSALSLGSAVHESLEAYYLRGDNPVEWLNRLYEDRINEAAQLGWFQSVQDEIAKEGDLAAIMVEGLLDWANETGMDDGMELIGVEKNLEAPIGDNIYIKGKLDQQWRRADGRVIFRDWKTCAGFRELDDGFLFNEQVKMYELLETLITPDQVTDGAQFVMLKKVKRTKTAKPPFYRLVEVRPNQEEIQSMFRRTKRSVEQIVQTDTMVSGDTSLECMQYACPPRPSRDCSWACPFFQVCPLMDCGGNWAGLLNERFEQVNPDARYEEKK